MNDYDYFGFSREARDIANTLSNFSLREEHTVFT